MDSELFYHLSLLSCRMLAILASATGLALLAVKAVRELWARYAGHREIVFLLSVYTYITDPDAPPPVIDRPRPFDDRILERLFIALSSRVSEQSRKKLYPMYEAAGFAARESRLLLGSWRWWIRARAAQRLGQMLAGSQKPALIRALEDPNIEVRLMAAWALGRLRDQESLKPIFNSLARFSKIAALRVSEIVLGFGAQAVPVIVELLKTPDPVVQTLAIRMLGELKDPRSARAVTPFLSSGNKELRIAACEALGRMGDRAAASSLRRALEDQEWPVVAKAAQSLGMLHDEASGPALAGCLGHRQWWVRLHAGEALACFGEPGRRSLDMARRLSPDRFARDMAAQWLVEMDHAPEEGTR